MQFQAENGDTFTANSQFDLRYFFRETFLSFLKHRIT
jgi:hypothetical protein